MMIMTEKRLVTWTGGSILQSPPQMLQGSENYLRTAPPRDPTFFLDFVLHMFNLQPVRFVLCNQQPVFTADENGSTGEAEG